MPKRILVTGAGGSPALNFINSLRISIESFYIIGTDCNKFSAARATGLDEIYLVPPADDPDYPRVLKEIIRKTGAEFLHSQNDRELEVISELRGELPVKTFLPAKETVRLCLNKYLCHELWRRAKVPQPKTLFIAKPADLKRAFEKLGAPLWLREVKGAAGKGSLLAKDLFMAKSWLDFCGGWGKFTAAEYLSPQSVTWQSIWKHGKVVVAQSRKRLYWEFANRSVSGVTGLTGTGVTVADSKIDKIAVSAIRAVDKNPNGIFSVDLTYDKRGVPTPTEINIGRFFTTHEFFSRAGLNMPLIYVKEALGEHYTAPRKKINPLKSGLAWVRGLDFLPKLTTLEDIEQYQKKLEKLLVKIKKIEKQKNK